MAKSDLLKRTYEKRLITLKSDPIKGIISDYEYVTFDVKKDDCTIKYAIKRAVQGTVSQNAIARIIEYKDGRRVWNHKYYNTYKSFDTAITRLEKLYDESK